MVSEDRLLAFFRNIVSIDAESYHERPMGEYIRGELEKQGLSITEDGARDSLNRRCGEPDADASGNLFTFLPATGPGEPVLFAAHLDTVRPGRGREAVIHEDGKITSAGNTVLGADDGVALAEILEFIHVIREEKLPHPRIEFLFASCEEPYAQGSRLFDFSPVEARDAYTLDLAGPIGTAAVAAPSILSFRIEVHGRSAHAGFAPEEGIHAISIAADAISHIAEGHLDPETTVNIGTIRGGEAMNIVPDFVCVTGEIRSLADEKAMAACASVRTAFEEAAARQGGEVTASCEKAFCAFSQGEDSRTVMRFRDACRELSVPVSLVTTFGGSDNNHIAEHGIPGIVLACGYENAHTVREYTWIEGMKQTVEIMLAIARSRS